MTGAAAKDPFFPGVAARVHQQLPKGLTLAEVIRKHDVRGRYRRPCFDADGKPIAGKFDEMVQSTRRHFDWIGKGFTLEELVDPLAAPVL